MPQLHYYIFFSIKCLKHQSKTLLDLFIIGQIKYLNMHIFLQPK